MSQPLAAPNRHITDNDKDGISFFSTAVPTALTMAGDLGGALQRLAYLVPVPPAKLTDQADLKAYEASLQDIPSLVPAGANTAVWYIDMPPASASPMHRTVSLDLVVQIQGEVELTLESGEMRTVKPGDLTIQRSATHMWRNPSKTEWTRMIGIMVECQPVQVGGKTLEGYFPHP